MLMPKQRKKQCRIQGQVRLDSVGYVTIPTGEGSRRLHVMVWKQFHGPIPKGHVIHHINEDRTDNRIENLQMMKRGDHKRHHMPERKKCFCGRPQNARRLCGKHYTEWQRKEFGRGNIMPENENRILNRELRDC